MSASGPSILHHRTQHNWLRFCGHPDEVEWQSLRSIRRILQVTWAMTALSAPAMGDVSYDSDVLPGGRASQFGGAYVAQSADASGLFYNPAGLADATKTASDSTTTFSSQTMTAEHVFGNQNVDSKTQGISTYLGYVKTLGEGVGVAAALFVPEANSRTQGYTFSGSPDLGVYNIDSNIKQDETFALLSGGIGIRVSDDTQLGVGLSVLRLQGSMVSANVFRYGPVTDGVHVTSPIYQLNARGYREGFNGTGADLLVGGLYHINHDLAVGVSIGAGRWFLFSTSSNASGMSLLTDGDGTPLGKTEADRPFSRSDSNQSMTSHSGLWRPRVRTGISWHPADGWTTAADIEYVRAYRFGVGDAIHDSQPVINAACGIEARMAPRVTARFGLFTNSDSAAKPRPWDDGSTYKHIDLWGASLGANLTRDKLTLGLGLTAQRGSGTVRAIALGAPPPIQSAHMQTFAVAATMAEDM